MTDKVRGWLREEVIKRGWSYNELARRSNVSQSIISRVLSGEREPSADFLIRIAQGLGESYDFVLRLAEILPPLPVEDGKLQELIEVAKNLSPDDLDELINYARFRYRQQR